MVKGTHRSSIKDDGVKDDGVVRLLDGAETSRRARATAARRRQHPHSVRRQSPSAIALFLSKKGKHVRREAAGLPRAPRVSNACNQLVGSVVLTLDELRQITNNFSHDQLIGEGAFGKVYKGVLNNGDIIAVKRFASTITGLQDVQYDNEAQHLMRLKHPNIVQLVGYCSETEIKLVRHNGTFVQAEKPERLLCLEYMPKGSLRGHLSDETSGLEWNTRYKTIEGICYGLHYLHEERQATPIIHMDLKPSNILLDDNMVPKIADFGLSRLFGEEKTRTCTTSCKGIPGYMAPEYIEKGVITKKFDIFSLGVIIIEIITGLKDYPTDETKETSQQYIDLVLNNWRHRLRKPQGYTSQDIDYQQIKNCIEIGLLCVKFDRAKRPTIKQIIKMLERSDEAYQNEREQAPESIFSFNQQHAMVAAAHAANRAGDAKSSGASDTSPSASAHTSAENSGAAAMNLSFGNLQPAGLTQRQESDKTGQDGPSSDDKPSHSQKSGYEHNFAVPVHLPNFAMMPAAQPAGSQSERKLSDHHHYHHHPKPSQRNDHAFHNIASSSYNPAPIRNSSSPNCLPVPSSIEEQLPRYGTNAGLSAGTYDLNGGVNNAGNPQRSFRARTTTSQQIAPCSVWPSSNAIRLSNSWNHQPPHFQSAFDDPQEVIPVVSSLNLQYQHPVNVQAANRFIGHGASSSRAGTLENRILGSEDVPRRNVVPSNYSDLLPPSAVDLSRLVPEPSNWSSDVRGTAISGSIPPVSRANNSSTVNPPAGFNHQNLTRRHPRNLSEEIGRLSGALRGHQPPRVRSGFLLERQGDGFSGEGRRLMEIQNALEMIHRGENVRLESIFYGGVDILDRHRAMRLDIDNMSYEELLALEERIANVSTGLSEEDVINR